MNKNNKQVDMLNGPLTGKIFMFSLPLAASSILQQLFNSADLAVVGRFSSSEAMAAVGSNSSVIALIVSLFGGMSVGANVVIGTLIGQNKQEKINEAVHTIFTFSLLTGIFVTFLGIFISRPILEMMGAPANVMSMAIEYLRIYFLAMPFMMIYNFGSAILRAKGDSSRPFYCLMISGILNVILNLFFVIVLDMSVSGVAIATVISNMLSAFFIIYFLTHEEDTFRLSFRKLSIHKEPLIKMIQIGLPAGLQGTLFAVSNVTIQSAINSYGAAAIAGNTAAQNFEFMSYFVVNAFSQAAITFTAQNYGAGKEDRCHEVLKICYLLGESITLAVSLIFWFGRPFFLSFFTTDPEVYHYAEIRMMLVCLLEVGTGSYEIDAGALRGMGKSLTPTLITLAGSCAFRLVYIATFYRLNESIYTLLAVYPISWLITGISMAIAYLKISHELFAEMAER